MSQAREHTTTQAHFMVTSHIQLRQVNIQTIPRQAFQCYAQRILQATGGVESVTDEGVPIHATANFSEETYTGQERME